jgi:hypothetical protein
MHTRARARTHAGDEWTPFDFTMSRFLHGSDEERNGMFKLIPHCAKGSWVVSQSVGTTPVILGRKLVRLRVLSAALASMRGAV